MRIIRPPERGLEPRLLGIDKEALKASDTFEELSLSGNTTLDLPNRSLGSCIHAHGQVWFIPTSEAQGKEGDLWEICVASTTGGHEHRKLPDIKAVA